MTTMNLGELLGKDFRLLTAKELATMLDVSLRSIWRWNRDGSLPPPIQIGRSVRWRLADIRKWIADGASV